MPAFSAEQLERITAFSDMGFLSILFAVALGMVVTLILHSSSASTAIVLTLAFQGLIKYEFAAGMVLGANIGTTIDAALAAIGTKIAAQRAALVHVLFNVIGTVWALIFFHPLLSLVNVIVPGPLSGAGLTTHIAMLHTVFNTLNTLVFLPFVDPFARLVSWIIKDKKGEKTDYGEHYRLAYTSASIQDTPELNIIRAEKEIRDMASLASAMFAQIGKALQAFRIDAEDANKESVVADLIRETADEERYADEMREELTRFLIECARQQLSLNSEKKVSILLRITASLEELTDDGYGASLLLERSVRKDLIFKRKETEALSEYASLVERFLSHIETLWEHPDDEFTRQTVAEIELRLTEMRVGLRKLGRKQIEGGENIKTELLFIDLVRRIEKVGDYCYSISGAIKTINTSFVTRPH
jgi:phosphate:Na+ symporter